MLDAENELATVVVLPPAAPYADWLSGAPLVDSMKTYVDAVALATASTDQPAT